MKKEIISVPLVGGPSAGKTSALSYIKRKLSEYGVNVLIVDEVATQFMNGGITPFSTKLHNDEFQKHLLHHMIEKENRWRQIADAMDYERTLILCDRGMMDSMAYVGEKSFNEIIKKEGWSIPQIRDERYEGVIHLRTAALGAEEHYTLSNNKYRTESPEQARALDQKTLDAWIGHPHLRVIDNSTGFQEKLNRTLQEICALLGIPAPLEIENKYLVKRPRLSEFPVTYRLIDIEQSYLNVDDERDEDRIRKRGQNNEWIYTRTQKNFVKTGTRSGIRIEKEGSISEEMFGINLLNLDPNYETIKKKRCCFIWQEQYFELDFFNEPKQHIKKNQGLLEIELTNENKTVQIPSFIEVIKEVTDDENYYNKHIARITQ
ncbi:hypothetical protein COB64_02750 [Candidatus Wolfebacteria bacterium]|nr:MAG: hypothetical protein COB64_02750 [Candidatus Wolfebacteria bacterium]